MVSNFEESVFQYLHDNFENRLPPAKFLQATSCLNRSTWPTDPLQRALYGESQVAHLWKHFQICTSDGADIVMEYAMFKNGVSAIPELQSFIQLLEVLPVSSADCERGFSQMNIYHTSGRNRLLVQSVSDMLMIGVNGPPLSAWNAEKYVISWLKSGRHGALDKATGLPKTCEIVPHNSKLFA